MDTLTSTRCVHDLAAHTCALCTPRFQLPAEPLAGVQSAIAVHEFTCPGCDALIPIGRRIYLVDGVWLGATCAEQVA